MEPLRNSFPSFAFDLFFSFFKNKISLLLLLEWPHKSVVVWPRLLAAVRKSTGSF